MMTELTQDVQASLSFQPGNLLRDLHNIYKFMIMLPASQALHRNVSVHFGKLI